MTGISVIWTWRQNAFIEPLTSPPCITSKKGLGFWLDGVGEGCTFYSCDGLEGPCKDGLTSDWFNFWQIVSILYQVSVVALPYLSVPLTYLNGDLIICSLLPISYLLTLFLRFSLHFMWNLYIVLCKTRWAIRAWFLRIEQTPY